MVEPGRWKITFWSWYCLTARICPSCWNYPGSFPLQLRWIVRPPSLITSLIGEREKKRQEKMWIVNHICKCSHTNFADRAAYAGTALAFRDRLIVDWNRTQQQQTLADQKRIYCKNKTCIERFRDPHHISLGLYWLDFQTYHWSFWWAVPLTMLCLMWGWRMWLEVWGYLLSRASFLCPKAPQKR